MLHFQTTNCRYCTLDTNTNKTYGAQLKPGGGSDEAPSCWSRCLDIYVTMSLMSLCVAMAHGSAAVLLWWCGAVVVLSSVLLLTDCTCWLQPGVTGPETSGQWSHSGGAAHWSLPLLHPFLPARPAPASPLSPVSGDGCHLHTSGQGDTGLLLWRADPPVEPMVDLPKLFNLSTTTGNESCKTV